MDNVATDHLLVKHLQKKLKAFKQNTTQDKPDYYKGYVKGIEDALNIAILHERQCKDPVGKGNNETKAKDKQYTPPKLHQMRAQKVAGLMMTKAKEKTSRAYSQSELAEAAFTFENELLGHLGDNNAIPFDTYINLPVELLIKIITTCTQKISRLENPT